MKKPLQSKPKPSAPPARSAPPLCSKAPRNANYGPAKANLSKLAREHGVSRESLRNWQQAEDLDLNDSKAIAARVSLMRSKAPNDLQNAKLAKILLESERIQLALDIERGKYVPADAIYQDGRNIGTRVREAFSKATSELPPMLGGQDAASIHKILKRYFRDVETTLATYRTAIDL